MTTPHVMLAYGIYPPIQSGGAELIVQYLAEGLAQRGNRVTVVSTCGPEMEPYPTETRNGVEVIRFFPKNRYWLFDRTGRSMSEKVRFHLKDAWNRDAGRRLREIMAESRPDILHTHCVEGFSPAIWRAAAARGIPLVHTAHDYHLICPRALLLTRKLKICTSPRLACRVSTAWNQRCSRAVNVFCSPSQFLLDRHLDAGLTVDKAVVVRNGIPVSHINVALTDTATETRPLRLLFAARLTTEKGVEVVLEAMRRLPATAPIELTIAGKGPLEDRVAAAAQADPRITYAGFLSGEAKHAAFLAADSVLLPSLWYENAPVVIVEAAAYGIGVIGSRLGAIPEFVQEGLNGFLFEPGNAQALADVMERLAIDRSALAAIRENSKKIIERYSVDKMVTEYSTHYDDLLRKNS